MAKAQIGQSTTSESVKALKRTPEEDASLQLEEILEDISSIEEGYDFTILGEGGIGKTKLGSTFPNCIFFVIESGTKTIKSMKGVKKFPRIRSTEQIIKHINMLGKSKHNYKTVVIDSITKLHDLIEREILAEDGKADSLATAKGGWGKGYAAAARRHKFIKEWFDKLKEEKGMNVVYIAHADVKQYTPPDEEPYDIYTLRLHKDSLPIYIDDVDCVAQIKLKTYVSGEDKLKKAHSSGERVLVCNKVASAVTKNRLGITEELPLPEGSNPLLPYLGL